MPDYEIHKVIPPNEFAPYKAEVVRKYNGWLAMFFATINCNSLNKLIAMMDTWPRYQAHPSDHYYAIWDVKARGYVK